MENYSKVSLLLVSILLFGIVGCESNNTTTPEEIPEVTIEETEEVESVDEEVLTENDEEITDESKDLDSKFNSLLASERVSTELVNFIDENISDLKEEDATNWIDKLEQKLDSDTEKRMNKIFELDTNNELLEIDGASPYLSEEKIDLIKNDELKNEVQENFNTFYKFVNVEGGFYPIVDYKKLSKYNEYISEELSDYINILSIDSEMKYFSDGARVITIEDLKNRILETETYLSNYSNGIREEKMTNEYEIKLRGYMAGLPNTPIYNFEDNKILTDIMDSFQETAALQNLATGQILAKYIEDIENNDFIIDEEILSKVDSYVAESVELIKNN